MLYHLKYEIPNPATLHCPLQVYSLGGIAFVLLRVFLYMKIAVLIPTRGDRPGFLKNCLRMLKAQTLQPDIIEIVNDIPLNKDCDITWRYRTGYDRLRNKGLDLIALIEDDDFYTVDYLQIMVSEWVKQGKPELLGTSYTIYYHLKLQSHFTMNHPVRSSAMNTLIKPDLNFNWCADNEPYTDMYLWNTLKGIVFTPAKIISIGIKHGVGLCGGRSHIDRLHRYTDYSLNLQSIMDPDSFNFYSTYFKNENNVNSPFTE